MVVDIDHMIMIVVTKRQKDKKTKIQKDKKTKNTKRQKKTKKTKKTKRQKSQKKTKKTIRQKKETKRQSSSIYIYMASVSDKALRRDNSSETTSQLLLILDVVLKYRTFLLYTQCVNLN